MYTSYRYYVEDPTYNLKKLHELFVKELPEGEREVFSSRFQEAINQADHRQVMWDFKVWLLSDPTDGLSNWQNEASKCEIRRLVTGGRDDRPLYKWADYAAFYMGCVKSQENQKLSEAVRLEVWKQVELRMYRKMAGKLISLLEKESLSKL